jgi:hypothetical protein
LEHFAKDLYLKTLTITNTTIFEDLYNLYLGKPVTRVSNLEGSSEGLVPSLPPTPELPRLFSPFCFLLLLVVFSFYQMLILFSEKEKFWKKMILASLCYLNLNKLQTLPILSQKNKKFKNFCPQTVFWCLIGSWMKKRTKKKGGRVGSRHQEKEEGLKNGKTPNTKPTDNILLQKNTGIIFF